MERSFKISGKPRRELKETLRRLKYQQKRWGNDEVRAARIRDIERSLDEKINSGERNLLNNFG